MPVALTRWAAKPNLDVTGGSQRTDSELPAVIQRNERFSPLRHIEELWWSPVRMGGRLRLPPKPGRRRPSPPLPRADAADREEVWCTIPCSSSFSSSSCCCSSQSSFYFFAVARRYRPSRC